MSIFYVVVQCNKTLEKLAKVEIREQSVLGVRIQEFRIPDQKAISSY